MTENQKKPPPSPLQRGNVATEKGECGDGKAEETFPLSHTPLSRTSLEEGELGTGKVKGM